VKSPPFSYKRVETIEQVFDLLDQYGEEARILAGGQSLMATLNMRLSAPKLLIDINNIKEMDQIKLENNKIVVGALTRHNKVANSIDIKKYTPLVSKALPHIAHHAIRNRGTFGGSIAFADPAAELPAVSLALEASFVLQSRNGVRTVLAKDFFLGLFDTALHQNEIIVAIEIPIIKEDENCSFIELSRRQGDYAMIGIAVQGTIKAGIFSNMRLAFFGAGDRPLMAQKAIGILEGEKYTKEITNAVEESLSFDLDPLNDLNGPASMKMHLARVIASRALSEITSKPNTADQ
jgi:carbon-monoxide dehydrogenase medium subunit|tara:strand:- start:3094 stop:3969 length:876 start_codon:yes stop_codon:yes gene_type:complete